MLDSTSLLSPSDPDRSWAGDRLPRYVRIADALQDRIRSGVYGVDSFLPGETTLTGEFRVSRGTVRQAIRVLEERGFVSVEVGRGTRVLNPQPRSTFFQLTDFNDEVRRSGRVPRTRLISRDVLPASREVVRRLRIPPKTEVIRLVRLRLADGVPLVYETRILARDMCPELVHENVEHQSVHHLLLDRYHIPLVRVELTVTRTPLPREAAHHLGVPAGTVTFLLDRVTFRSERVPVTWFHAYYLSDHFDLTVQH